MNGPYPADPKEIAEKFRSKCGEFVDGILQHCEKYDPEALGAVRSP